MEGISSFSVTLKQTLQYLPGPWHDILFFLSYFLKYGNIFTGDLENTQQSYI